MGKLDLFRSLFRNRKKIDADKLDLLRSISFGESVAEQETELGSYFVETEAWRGVYSGDFDVVYGVKGSGKSALYSLLLKREAELYLRKIILVPAENPSGNPAFRDLAIDTPTTERELIGLWKLYFAALLHGVFIDKGIGGAEVSKLESILAGEGLVRGSLSLQSLLRTVWDFARGAFRVRSVEAGVDVDSTGQGPIGVKGKITFSEPTADQSRAGFLSIDQLLSLADTALTKSGFTVWILLDRLDVAFTDNVDLEYNALRALFRVYLDLFSYSDIRLKIFLRTDIWNRISQGGFREASHIVKSMTIHWNTNSLLNLVVQRALSNENLRTYYGVTSSDVLSSISSQEVFFYRMFPEKVDLGQRTPSTFDWILGRTRDGTTKNAPREIIQLLNFTRAAQIRRFEIGAATIPNGRLFERAAIKAALPDVSKFRLTQTLYAEYPSLHDRLEQLRGKKTQQTVGSLSEIWGTPAPETLRIAHSLVEAGFFEQRGSRDAPEYKVPFLYRDALSMSQGSAE